jgi:hypothetical protein
MEWPPQFILIRLRQLARLKLQPRELLATLRELAREYKAFLAGNAVARRLTSFNQQRTETLVSANTPAQHF